MKLLYLYIDDFPPFKKTEMCFASGYLFHRQGNSLRVDFREILPKDFFSPKSQLYISALVGPNGAGKTSLIRILEAIKHPIKRMMFILAIEAKGDILVYYNLGGDRLTVEATGCVIEDRHVINAYKEVGEQWMDYDALSTCFNLVYYSPHYTLSGNLFHNDDRFADISTTALINELSEDSVTGRRHVSAAFKADEFRRLVQFYDSRIDMFPDLRGIAFVPNIYATNDLSRCFYELVSQEKGRIERLANKQYDHPTRRCTDEELARLEGMLSFLTVEYEDGFMQMIQALAAHIWNCGTYQDGNFKESDFGGELYRCLMWIKDSPSLTDVERRKYIVNFLKGHICKAIGSCKIPVDAGQYRRADNPLYEFFLQISKLKSTSGKDGTGSLILPWNQVSEDIELLSALYAHCSKIGSFVELKFDPARSTGEYALHTFYARLVDHFAEIRDLVAGYDGSDFSREFAKHLESGWIVVLDEVEVTLHPEWQRGLVDDLLREFNNYFQGFNVHFIFATHSPIILSDMPKGNIVFIDGDHKVVESDIIDSNTFGANIYDLYRLAFNQKNGTTGEFASQKIKDALTEVALVVKSRVECSGTSNIPKGLNSSTKQVLSQIGDPVLRKYLDGLRAGGLI